jgi:hypothetical protein
MSDDQICSGLFDMNVNPCIFQVKTSYIQFYNYNFLKYILSEMDRRQISDLRYSQSPILGDGCVNHRLMCYSEIYHSRVNSEFIFLKKMEPEKSFNIINIID